MTNKQKRISITILALVCIALIIAVVLFLKIPTKTRPNDAVSQSQRNKIIDLTKIAYDAKTTILGTGVTISYPKNGYYNNGLTLVKSDSAPIFVFNSIANLYVSSMPVGSADIDVDIYKIVAGQTLETALKIVANQMTDLKFGHYQEINSTQYFLVPSDLSTSIYTAYAIIKGNLLVVTFDSGFLTKDHNTAPAIVTQFLSRLDFTCKADCSVNSAAITEQNRVER